MAVKSTTQMTKAELLQVIRDKDRLIADLNHKIDELENMAVTSQSIPLEADISVVISSLNARIKALEEKINEQD